MEFQEISKELVLNNGVSIPRIGFGCAFGNWTKKSDGLFYGFTPEGAWYAVPAALKAGYRLFDCALLYGSQHILGQSIGAELREGRLQRQDLFITSKVFHGPTPIALNSLETSFDIAKYLADPTLDVRAFIVHDYERCLAELNLGYLDLLLMHYPGLWNTTDKENNERLRLEVWGAFEDLYLAGKVRAIGVSNFLVRHLDSLLKICRVKPMVNQIEVSPYIEHQSIINFCQENGIVVQAWSPFGSGTSGVLQDEVVNEIAKKHNRNSGQVILRWMIQKDLAVVPKSSIIHHININLEIYDFALDKEEMKQIDNLNKNISTLDNTSDSIA